MMNIHYFLDDAQNSRQGQFELDFADVITCFDTTSTTLVTEEGRTLVINWTDAGFFKSYKVIYETAQMENATMRWEVQNIIDKLKFLEVDGETMQYILEKVGMSDQMLRQLMLTQPFDDVEYVWEERKNL